MIVIVTFGERLKELRASRDITQTDLAKILKVGTSNIGNYERGFSNPSIDKLIALTDYFNVSADYLLGRSDIPTTIINSKNIRKMLYAINDLLISNNDVYYDDVLLTKKEKQILQTLISANLNVMNYYLNK